ncbi:MAG: hypothetical protein EWV63_04265 [Microcystis aeruginosa Ma_OC_H_19870700_S124]|uniref:Uncharacterized protein n=2 Tax=Microcystis TaxID=1125 RepID=A0A552AUX1_MICAE|nr:MAG: hypothetical protein EWV63_04265 [Microcystis aeruginosa Ma_OC_H_19870700_S124]
MVLKPDGLLSREEKTCRSVTTGQQTSCSGKLYQKKTVLTAMPSQPDGTGTCKMGLVATKLRRILTAHP